MRRLLSMILFFTLALSACGTELNQQGSLEQQAAGLHAGADTDSSGAAAQRSGEPDQSSRRPGNAEDDRIDITLKVGDETFAAELEDNETVRALTRQFPLTLEMEELNGNEKYYNLDDALPTSGENPGQVQAGDLMLYGEDCLVLFYESFSTGYRYTRLGSVQDVSGLTEALGRGSVTVTFDLG